MAPSSIHALPLDTRAAGEKSRRKKPLADRCRHECLSSSVQRLKLLLGKELQRSQPCSKLEQDDTLERTVSSLRPSHTMASLTSTSTTQGYSKGYSSCLRETLKFLAAHSASSETQSKLLSHLQKFGEAARNDLPHPCGPKGLQKASTQNASSKRTCVLWRPW
uniref:Hes family bHLH transcription factor 5 n=1 Tax=Salvator merianae TaxID=96440 RepID=A0A8D0DKT6_SALMN